MSVRVLQLTDCHLMADPLAELKGIRTRERFEQVLAVINSRYADADLLVVTGDLTHDERPETYLAMRELLADWSSRLRVIPGNHDDRESMRQVFQDPMQRVADRNVFVTDLGGWRLIGLDSQRPGELSGELGEPQLAWLDEQLRLQSGHPTGVFVHHPPFRVNSAWLDRIGLSDAAPLLDLLGRHAQVRFVSCGHVHQERTVLLPAIKIETSHHVEHREADRFNSHRERITAGHIVGLTTPATGVQFRPETEALEVDSAAPGFRILDLSPDGSMQTRVERVG